MISNRQQTTLLGSKSGERGAALVMAIILLGLLSGISLCALAVVSNESRVAGSDLRRTQTFYAASAGIEKMTSDFSALFLRTSNPTQAQLDSIAAAYPSELTAEGYVSLVPSGTYLQPDDATLTAMRQSLGITNGSYPTVTIPSGPFAGLLATVSPYKLKETVRHAATNTEVSLEREMNNYLIPLFQFGMFSDKDIELHPGPPFVFNGRIHTNGNLYLNGDVTMRDKVTVANELVYNVLRNNSTRTGANVRMIVGSTTVSLTMGSVVNGPNLPGAVQGGRGYFPTSPNGTDNTTWKNTSVAAPQSGVANKFGGQLLTRTTGAVPLLLPLQLGGNPPRELIKRQVTGEAAIDPILNQSRYHTKSEIRILIDDESSSGDAAGIPSTKGVRLSQFLPSPLNNGKATWRMSDSGGTGTYVDTSTTAIKQETDSGNVTAHFVRRVNATSYKELGTDPYPNEYIPGGSGITGRILIEIVPPATSANPAPTPIDVTQTILSMGVTEGEPNAIVMLQRPLWTAFTQGMRDSSGGSNNLVNITTNTSIGVNGEITTTGAGAPTLNSTYGFITNITNDDGIRKKAPPAITDATNNNYWNAIVPINMYNPREGWINNSLSEANVYERGMTSIVEINMRNLARWVDGVYDTTLLNGTQAVSTNIDGASYNGYIVYISDRRGDKIRTETDLAGNSIQMTNGMVDNEDIYGPNGTLDPGEDVQEKGVLKKFTNELPDPSGGTIWTLTGSRQARAVTVEGWANPTNYFRRAVRLYDGDDLQITGGSGKLSQTKGITIATENMLYIWGNFNTTGIASAPGSGTATLNDGGYLGNQVPASVAADAVFPLSKTWSDSMGAYNPEGGSGGTARTADIGVSSSTQETSVRTAIISGTNLSALSGSPDAGNGADSRLSGGMHNFPRFLENWLSPQRRWNYVGSICPLYYSTQALGPWTYIAQEIYGAPSRNWAFDTTFRDPNRLPPGTPMFQYIESTGFRQVLQ